MRIFLTGATGYIGGSLANQLRDAGHHVIGLVRDKGRADELRRRGIEPLIGDLSSNAAVSTGVQGSDVTINLAESDDIELVRPLIAAMAGTGKTLIHTSGSSIAADDAQGAFATDVILPDDAPFAPQGHRLPRIGVDHLVRSAGVTGGIRAIVVCPSTVYGTGTGIKLESHQLPILIAKSSLRQAGVYVGSGAPIWSHVHISDLTDLYVLALEKAPSASFFYAEAGEMSWKEIAVRISLSLGFQGRTESWSLSDAEAEHGIAARAALASNCRVRASNARRALGWVPKGPSLSMAISNTEPAGED